MVRIYKRKVFNNNIDEYLIWKNSDIQYEILTIHRTQYTMSTFKLLNQLLDSITEEKLILIKEIIKNKNIHNELQTK